MTINRGVYSQVVRGWDLFSFKNVANSDSTKWTADLWRGHNGTDLFRETPHQTLKETLDKHLARGMIDTDKSLTLVWPEVYWELVQQQTHIFFIIYFAICPSHRFCSNPKATKKTEKKAAASSFNVWVGPCMGVQVMPRETGAARSNLAPWQAGVCSLKLMSSAAKGKDVWLGSWFF